jgi:nicotinate-nucleotide--dimethylbenzimidazole phosphoribosyltransferase
MSLLAKTLDRIEGLDRTARAQAETRLEQLVMPHWALGRVMDLARDLAGMTGTVRPSVARRTVVIMAGDHGVAAENVSLYPSAVTLEMVHNFVRGGAGINALARQAGARVVVVDLGVAGDLEQLASEGKIISKKIRAGTSNLARGPAMTPSEAVAAVEAGIEVALALGDSTDLFATGDMGIGNTTPSSAMVAVLTGKPAHLVTGPGTGLGGGRLENKVAVIERALTLNAPNPHDPLDVLAKVGGFEIGGIAGLILGAASLRRPVLVDGFISTAGAVLAERLCPNAREYMIAAHLSPEPGHQAALELLNKRPLLDLGLRLGEGTGAVLAMGVVAAAAALLTEVATFAEASVTGAGA